MKPEIIKVLIKAKLPKTPRQIFNRSKLKISYKTFYRAVIKLLKKGLIHGWKINNGNNRGNQLVIDSVEELNEQMERETKT